MPKIRPINTNIKEADIENYASRCKDIDIEKDNTKEKPHQLEANGVNRNQEIENESPG